HLAGGIFRDESEVDDPDQSAVYKLGELRHDLTGERVAGEAENQIFHRADVHGLSLLAPASAERHNYKSPANAEKGPHPQRMIHGAAAPGNGARGTRAPSDAAGSTRTYSPRTRCP